MCTTLHVFFHLMTSQALNLKVRNSLPKEDGSDDRLCIGDGPTILLGIWQPHLRIRRPHKTVWQEATAPVKKEQYDKNILIRESGLTQRFKSTLCRLNKIKSPKMQRWILVPYRSFKKFMCCRLHPVCCYNDYIIVRSFSVVIQKHVPNGWVAICK